MGLGTYRMGWTREIKKMKKIAEEERKRKKKKIVSIDASLRALQAQWFSFYEWNSPTPRAGWRALLRGSEITATSEDNNNKSRALSSAVFARGIISPSAVFIASRPRGSFVSSAHAMHTQQRARNFAGNFLARKKAVWFLCAYIYIMYICSDIEFAGFFVCIICITKSVNICGYQSSGIFAEG